MEKPVSLFDESVQVSVIRPDWCAATRAVGAGRVVALVGVAKADGPVAL